MPAQATAAQAEKGGESLLQQALDKGYLPATLDGDVQKISADLNPSVYPFIIVQKGIPVEFTITAEEQNITGCNQTVVLPSFDVKKALTSGDNVIKFTPEETGLIPYTCWMGMLDGRILVVDDLFAATAPAATPAPAATTAPADAEALEPAVPNLNTTRSPGSCCG